ncbi:hypothetical protein [Corynebacterium pelargi]|uniref:hypothetical protein n=1 Tax=Corynebacterium pelargi TaxID=1471400 RepID=UPI0019D6F4F2|nr:hypothetical protein [Corynebacterium pelargi]
MAICIGFLIKWDAVIIRDNDIHHGLLNARPSWFTTVMIAATSLFNPLSATILSMIIGVVVWWWTKVWRSGVYILAAVALSAFITQVFKRVFEHSRPPELHQILVETHFRFSLWSCHCR